MTKPQTVRSRRGRPSLEQASAIDRTLLRVAQDLHVDLISMGAQSHGALGHLLLGSTTHTVVRRATCPVLITRG